MRLTVLHVDKTLGSPRATDVEVIAGTAAATLREEVARLTGRPEWVSARRALVADGVTVDGTHPAGLAPLLPGAVLSVDGGTSVPVESRVAAAPRHLAVTGGPDAGTLLVLPGTDRCAVGPESPLAVRDDRWGPLPLQVQIHTPHARRWSRRPGRERAPVVLVRTAGTAVLVRRRRGSQRRHAVPRRRWARWRVGDEVQIGASTLELRGNVVARAAADPSPNRPGTGSGTADEKGRRGGQLAAIAVSTAGRMVTGVVLALAMHQPWLALTGLAGSLLWWANRRTAPAAVLQNPPEPGTTAPDVAALRLAVAVGAPPGDLRVPAAWDEGGCLAVVGPGELALAAARAVVVGELGARALCDVTVRGGNQSDWTWLVWTGAASPTLPSGGEVGTGSAESRRALVVVDGPNDMAPVTRWRAHAPTSHRLLWIGRDVADAPAWCRNVLAVTATEAQLRCGERAPRPVRVAGVRADVAEAHGRALARAGAVAVLPAPVGSTGAADLRVERCPEAVALGALPGVPQPEPSALRAAWATPPPGLRTPLGTGPDGEVVVVDLVRDGPHAIVAGTTGAGKSELLTTLVLGLALRYPPQRLALLLVDFKGGTGLPGLVGLPHVVGRLSDLDGAGARRVLLGLGAELRRRERLVAAAGARDVEELRDERGDPAPAPSRLLVVIDEFRALADDLPELLPGLARLAAQGRSLGVHLVLATQRPAGAVSPELRANVSLRVALRVVDAGDSVDLVGVPDAARIDSRTPGRAVLVRGGGAAQGVQVARAGALAEPAPVRLAPSVGAVLGVGPGRAWVPAAHDRGPDLDPVAEWVAAAAAASTHLPVADVRWLPELPERVRAGDVAPGPGLALAVADVPEEQRRAGLRWDPDQGHLLVLGGPRSGRSTTLVAVGRQALAAGRDVHALGLPRWAVEALRAGAPGRLGTVASTEDPVTVARLLEALARQTSWECRPVVLVDGLELALDRLGTIARGAGAQLLTALWERSDPPLSLAASAPVSAWATRLLGAFADRLVLGVADPSLDALAGVPPALAGPRTVPGRAVHIRAAAAVVCQAALPDDAPVPAGSDRRSTAVLRLAPPPSRARRGRLAVRRSRDGRLRVPLGLGADGQGPVQVDLRDSLLVAGPPGSGRTTALGGLAATLGRCGLGTCTWSQLIRDGSTGTADGLLDAVDAAGELVVLVDDLDEIERTEPGATQQLADRLTVQRREPPGAGPRLRIVAATTTAHALASYRGLVPAMLRARRLVALDLHEPGSVELLGSPARWLADPRGGQPGRGALRRDSSVVPVQLWEPIEG